MASKRGGGSAPARCKSGLGSCMTGEIRGGKTFRSAARACMVKFNDCRGVGRARKSKGRKGRKGRR